MIDQSAFTAKESFKRTKFRKNFLSQKIKICGDTKNLDMVGLPLTLPLTLVLFCLGTVMGSLRTPRSDCFEVPHIFRDVRLAMKPTEACSTTLTVYLELFGDNKAYTISKFNAQFDAAMNSLESWFQKATACSEIPGDFQSLSFPQNLAKLPQQMWLWSALLAAFKIEGLKKELDSSRLRELLGKALIIFRKSDSRGEKFDLILKRFVEVCADRTLKHRIAEVIEICAESTLDKILNVISAKLLEDFLGSSDYAFISRTSKLDLYLSISSGVNQTGDPSENADDEFAFADDATVQKALTKVPYEAEPTRMTGCVFYRSLRDCKLAFLYWEIVKKKVVFPPSVIDKQEYLDLQIMEMRAKYPNVRIDPGFWFDRLLSFDCGLDGTAAKMSGSMPSGLRQFLRLGFYYHEWSLQARLISFPAYFETEVAFYSKYVKVIDSELARRLNPMSAEESAEAEVKAHAADPELIKQMVRGDIPSSVHDLFDRIFGYPASFVAFVNRNKPAAALPSDSEPFPLGKSEKPSCNVCLEVFDDEKKPVQLCRPTGNCPGHFTCVPCTRTLYNQGDRHEFPCPVCRQRVSKNPPRT